MTDSSSCQMTRRDLLISHLGPYGSSTGINQFFKFCGSQQIHKCLQNYSLSYGRNTEIVDFRKESSRSLLTLPWRRLGRSLQKVVSQTIMTTESSYGHMADVSWKRATDCSRVSIK
ncbi:hypothetical protein M0804_002895 [Polistes exclamans]|nr:hypothetical protein M0804_002895 [Polistes exclamans]